MNPLTALLNLSPVAKAERGREHTPQEIAQQPETWLAPTGFYNHARASYKSF